MTDCKTSVNLDGKKYCVVSQGSQEIPLGEYKESNTIINKEQSGSCHLSGIVSKDQFEKGIKKPEWYLTIKHCIKGLQKGEKYIAQDYPIKYNPKTKTIQGVTIIPSTPLKSGDVLDGYCDFLNDPKMKMQIHNRYGTTFSRIRNWIFQIPKRNNFIHYDTISAEPSINGCSGGLVTIEMSEGQHRGVGVLRSESGMVALPKVSE